MKIVSNDAPTMVGFLPHESDVKAPMADPIGAPIDIASEEPNDAAMLRPSRTKNVGSQSTNP